MDNERKIDFVLVSDAAHGGDDDADIRLAIDLGDHAAREAVAAMVRIGRTAPQGDQIMVAAVAHARLQWKLQSVADEIDKTVPGFKKAVAKWSRRKKSTLATTSAISRPRRAPSTGFDACQRAAGAIGRPHALSIETEHNSPYKGKARR